MEAVTAAAVTPRLEGRRLVLRGVVQADVTVRYRDWLNDPEVNRHLETRHEPQTLETIAEYVQSISNAADQRFWAICLKDTGAHIGNIKLGPISSEHRNASVSLFIGEKALWGRGYAADAIGLVCDHAFGALELHKLRAGAYADNAGSIRAFEKCGFRVEGRLREQAYSDGHYVDVILLGRLAHDPVRAA